MGFTPNEMSQLAGALTGFVFGIIAFCFIIVIVALVIQIFLYKKMGYEWWEALIAGHNIVCLFEAVGMNPALILLAMIPFANFVFLILLLVARFKLCKCFGKGTLFAILSIPFGTICLAILAFGRSEYGGPA